MKLSILHVMSQVELTGAEVHALALARHQISKGHDVWVVADELHLPTTARFVALPISDRTYRARLLNVRKLRRLIQDLKIDVVHAHSRAASWVANYALKWTRVPLISTVHGRQHWHGRFKKNDVYGEQVLAVCENIRSHLIHEFNLRPGKVVTLGNPIEWREGEVAQHKLNIRIAILGRTTGPKGERAGALLQHVVPRILSEFPNVIFQIGGGAFGRFEAETRAQFDQTSRAMPGRLQFIGNGEFWDCLRNSNLVIASGRIAAESLGLGIPTYAMGEAIVHGFVDQTSIHDCLLSNFGDVQAERRQDFPFQTEIIYKDLAEWLKSNSSRAERVQAEIQERIRNQFDAERIFKRVEQIYRLNIFKLQRPLPIPCIMYHKVPLKPLESKHKIFVTKETFAWQMHVLKRKGYVGIDFETLKQFVDGERPLSEFPERPILLTFDDGYRDNLSNAFPLLRELGFRATLFVLSDRGVQTNTWDTDSDLSEVSQSLMDLEELKQCQKLGISIGSHGLSHRHLPELTVEESKREIEQSKRDLELTFESPVVAFAYPFGSHTEVHEQQAAEAGYDFAVATDRGGMRFEENPYSIFRVNVFPNDTGMQFIKKISPHYRRYFHWKRGH